MRASPPKRAWVVGLLGVVGAILAPLLDPSVGHAADLTSVACGKAALLSALHTIDQSPSGSGTISLAKGCTYTLDGIDNTTDGPSGLPVVRGSVTILGSGATLARAPSAPPFRFFTVDAAGALNLQRLTLRGGAIPAGQTLGGGAILNLGNTDVSGVTFSGNASLATVGGGAIDNHNLGHLTVDLSKLIGNSSVLGGAVENEATYCDTSRSVCGLAIVARSTFRGNSTSVFGGGAVGTAHANGQIPACPPPAPGPCEMRGGATTLLTSDTLADNTAETDGGAVANAGTTSIMSSTITHNVTVSDDDRFGGGGIQNTGVLTVTSSTLAGNASAFGANIHTYHDTVNGLAPPVTTFASTIVAALGAPGSSCGGQEALIDAGYNLDTGTSCGFSVAQHSQINAAPQLGALASHGGPTQTMALGTGSAAIDVIPTATPGCTGAVDQRGIQRPNGSGCDIGAMEMTLADRVAAAGIARPSARFVRVGQSRGVYAGPGVRRVSTSVGPGLLASARGATTFITFAGSHLDLQLRAGPAAGRARLLVAGQVHVVDLYAPGLRTVTASVAVRRGVHTARVIALGSHSPSSRGTAVLLIALQVRS